MCEFSSERHMVNKWWLIANLHPVIILMLAHAHCMFYHFQNACGRHRITPEILIKMKIVFFFFFAFKSLISIAEVEMH